MAESFLGPLINIPLHTFTPYTYVTLSSTKPELMIRQPSISGSNRPIVRATSSFRSNLSEVRKYVVRRRLWLLCLGFLCCICTIAGIAYSCHVNYVAAGGVGWIKYARSVGSSEKDQSAETFLPMRKVQLFHIDSGPKRDPGVLPYYACGDQLQSCVAFNQPVGIHKNQMGSSLTICQDICCPITTSCFSVPFTPSGILCCNATSLKFCDYSSHNSPSCVAGTTQCSALAGGGCCPNGTLCSQNGCIQFLDASVISSVETIPAKTLSAHTIETLEPFMVTSLDSSHRTGQPQVPTPTVTFVNSQNPSSMAGNSSAVSQTLPITVTTTMVEVPATSVTIAKQGEVATGTARKVSAICTLWFPYASAAILIIIAAIMGML
jgi:hypothetical protein